MASNSNGPSGDERPRDAGILAHLMSNYVNAGLYFARIGTIFSCLAFLFSPFFSGSNPAAIEVWYRRALLASAATSAFRLHQRLKSVATPGLSRALFDMLLAEDSFHYLLYSVVFAFLPPISVCLMPVFLFAVLHVANFTQILLNVSAPRSNAATGDGPHASVNITQPSYMRNLVQTAVTKVNSNDQTILRLIALNEIMLMVVCIVMAVSGPRIIILPFLYYPFLKRRYYSRRNPHCRVAFYELRSSLQTLAFHPKCPTVMSRLINGLINIVSRLGATGH